MKVKVTFILFLMNAFVFMSIGQEDPFLRDFLERWENSKKYFLAVAEAMPEDKYHEKVYEEGMNFAEQLMHVALIIDWHAFSKFDGRESGIRWEEFKSEGKTKQQMIRIAEKEFDRAKRLIATFDPERLDEKGSYADFTRTRRQFLLLLADHVSHHRAQMIVYLRLQNITPPNYINYQ
ncbi:DinB family protein [Cyclobacterium sp.]|uniref:DinB family protein n=1 Tax=Cyclobacterium sp. TaxID=1966343 RepID=UPI0019884A22|nr:DinB family protein [Cyclobacterium sp.]MBD3626966.1 DinB family protein [Cyclobacterium sp.]